MRNIRPRRRGRPPKNTTNNSRYISSRTGKYEDEDEDSNQSSISSSEKYSARSNRRSLRNSHVEPKKRGRKRKIKDSDDEYYDDEEANQDDEETDSQEENDFDEMDSETEEEELETDNKRPGRPARENAPIFLDDTELPELVLPASSEDLLIPNNELIPSLAIYETLRRFSNSLRLTPFRFEDFCVALLINEQAYLLSEIHIQLLKALIHEDDLIGTQHGPQEVRDSINIYLYLLDQITWPEVLRIYLSSDMKKNGKIINECLDDNYPFTTLRKKLALLQYLCDEFLNTQIARDMLFQFEGRTEHEEFCRVCQRNGEMLICEGCPAVFHLACLDPPLKQVPDTDWYCPVCKLNEITGVTDCINEYESNIIRQEPIGWDRHGRLYWFLARRFIVEDRKSEKVWYYSSRLQFEQLLSVLDNEYYETDLCQTINELHENIYQQLTITEKLVKIAKGSRKSYLEVINEELYFKQIAKLTEGLTDPSEIEKVKFDLESKLLLDDEDLRSGIQTRLKTGSLQPKSTDIKCKINVYNSIGRDDETYIIVQEDNTLIRTAKKLLPANFNQTSLFKLGLEGNYRNYQNVYNVEALALSKTQVQDDRDKKRHLGHKFSLTPISELKWGSYNVGKFTTNSINGTETCLINNLRQALLYLESNLIQPFMHPNWKRHRERWLFGVSNCFKPDAFATAMYVMESSVKPVLFNHSWNDLLGFTVLQRTTQLERDELKKKEKKGRDNNADLTIDLDVSTSRFNPNGAGIKLVNGKLKHQIWKQKGEEYRLSGVGGWFWHNYARIPYQQQQQQQHVKTGVTEQTEEDNDNEPINIFDIIKPNYVYNPKHFKNTNSLDQLIDLRIEMIKLDEKMNPKDSVKNKFKCYSPTCTLEDYQQKYYCYSPSCRAEYNRLKYKLDASAPVELKKIIEIDGVEQYPRRNLPFNFKIPLPPSGRFANGNFKSLLVPLNYDLRQLGRLAGLYEVSGFSYNSKINYAVWPYGLTPRPNFRTTWLFRTHNAKTLHGIALQLRVFWAAIRWDDLYTKPPASGTNTITTESEVQTIEILKRRDMPPFCLKSEYLIRTIIVPLDLPLKTSREHTSAPNRSGLRERRRPESPQNKGPTMSERWAKEEELELWEIKQFYDKQLLLAKQQQRQIEMKKKMEEYKILSQPKVNGANISVNAPRTISKFSPMNRNLITTNSPTINATFQTNSQTIKIPATAKPTQLLIRGNQLQMSNLGQNRSAAFIIRAPSTNTTSPRSIIIQSSSLNGPIIRPISAIQSGIRQSIPFIATNCVKKISTLTTTNAILTTNSIKTINSTNTNTNPTTTNLSTLNSKVFTGLPIKYLDGRPVNILPITSLPNTVQLQLNNNNQIRVLAKSVENSNNKTILANVIMQNGPKFVLPSNNNTQKIVTTSSSASTSLLPASTAKPMILKTSFVDQKADAAETLLKSSTVNTSTPKEEKSFVVTSEMTQEVVRKALLNANQTPELAQKLIAFQRHHQEKTENRFSSRYESTPRVSRHARYVRSKYENDDDYIYEYPQAVERTPRNTEDDIGKVCRNIVRSLIDKLEKEEKKRRHLEILEEKRIKKEIQNRAKYRVGHIDAILKACLYKQILFTEEIKFEMSEQVETNLLSKEFDEKQEEDEMDEALSIGNNLIKKEINQQECYLNKVENESPFQPKRKRPRLSIDNENNDLSFNHDKQAMFFPAVSNEVEIVSYCICNNPNDNSPTIDCSICSNKFHIRCVKITNYKYTCEVCISNKSTDFIKDEEIFSPKKQIEEQSSMPEKLSKIFNSNLPMESSSLNINQNESSGNFLSKPLVDKTLTPEKLPVKTVSLDQSLNSQNSVEEYVQLNEFKTPEKVFEQEENKSNNSLNSEKSVGRPRRNQTVIKEEPLERSRRQSQLKERPLSLPDEMNVVGTSKRIRISTSNRRLSNNQCTSSKILKTPKKRGRGRPPKAKVEKLDETEDSDQSEEDPNKIYCYCREKYSSDEFFINCDYCGEWYHGKCVAITCFRANDMPTFHCPTCEIGSKFVFKKLTENEYEFMKGVFNDVKKHPMAKLFLKPLTGEEGKKYFSSIKEPIDMSVIECKLKLNKYFVYNQFLYDMYKMFDNWRFVFTKGELFEMANQLEEYLLEKIDPLIIK